MWPFSYFSKLRKAIVDLVEVLELMRLNQEIYHQDLVSKLNGMQTGHEQLRDQFQELLERLRKQKLEVPVIG